MEASTEKATATDPESSVQDSAGSGLSIQKLEQLASVTPSFPSPSSSFIPPPMHDPNDFVNRTKPIVAAKRRDTSASQLTNTSAAVDTGSPKEKPSTDAPATEEEGASSRQEDNIDTKAGEGKVAGKARPVSDPYGDKENHGLANGRPAPDTSGSSPKPTSPRMKHLSTPPPQSGHPHPQFLPMTLANQELASSPSALSPPSQSASYFSMIPEAKRASLTSLSSNRRAPASPTPSRHSSMLPSRRGSKRMSVVRTTTGNERQTPQRRLTSTVLMKIRDFAFSADDERHSAVKKINLRDSRRPGSKRNSSASTHSDHTRPKSGGGWGAFFQASAARFGFGSDTYDGAVSGGSSRRTSRLSGYVPRGASYNPPLSSDDPESSWHGSSSQEEEFSDPQPGATSESDYEHESEAPFVPGYYRAVYSFEPEGSSEMALEEGQIVQCLARGGGPGWVIAIKQSKGDDVDDLEVSHALVPEGYLELQRSFESGDLGGTLTPRTRSAPST